MQAVIAIKQSDPMIKLDTPVCGVPLLARVVLTAARSGCKSVLLLCPPSLPAARVLETLRTAALPLPDLKAVDLLTQFNEADAEHWRHVSPHLEDRFLWIPWSYIPHRLTLSEVLDRAARMPGANVRFTHRAAEAPPIFDGCCVLLKCGVTGDCAAPIETILCDREPGVVLGGSAAVAHAEKQLVRNSGKVTDGIYSTFNRKLCRPAVRWLSRTPVTPNAVTFGGLAVALLSAMLFARGDWLTNVAGAVLFFVSGLFDEMDGMLARLKFRESPFGCWLETMVDYATYILIFVGMAIGGYRRSGPEYIALGAALVFGSLLSFWVISIQRKLVAPADRPNEYSRRYLSALDRDQGNLISSAIRQLHFLTKKGVLVHYLLVFAIAGLLPLFMALAALGANIAWMVTLYFTARLFSDRSRASEPSQRTRAEVKS